MKTVIMTILVAMALNSVAQAANPGGCFSNLSEKALTSVERHKQLYTQGLIDQIEYNLLISGVASVAHIGSLACRGTGDADFSNAQIRELIKSINSNKVQ